MPTKPPRIMLIQHHHPPPHTNYARDHGGFEVGVVTVRVDQYDNVELYISANEARLTPLQRRMVDQLRRAAGWPEKP